jgi:hypothetical protein
VSSKRLYFVLLGLIGLLFIGLLAGAYGADRLLVTQAAVLTDYKAKSQAIEKEQTVLVQDKMDILKYANLEAIAKAVVPEDKSQAEAVQEIVNIAAANNVVLGSITFPPSTLGNASGGSAGSTSSSGASASQQKLPSSATSPNSKANKLSQLVTVPGIPGIYQLSITITTNPKYPIYYYQLIGFLKGLEGDRRTAQVDSISLQPAPLDPTALDCTIILNEYIKP